MTMTPWILIATILWYRAPAIATQEFSTEVACREAARQFIAVNKDAGRGAYADVQAICVKK